MFGRGVASAASRQQEKTPVEAMNLFQASLFQLLKLEIHCDDHLSLSYYSTIAPFYHIRTKERAKYATLLYSRTGQKYGLKEGRQNCRTKLYFISGIIYSLFDGLTYNTSGHFAHCSYFSSPLRARKNTTQLAKYPRVLYVKPSNKVYLLKTSTEWYITIPEF